MCRIVGGWEFDSGGCLFDCIESMLRGLYDGWGT